jgi:hypothetical protein
MPVGQTKVAGWLAGAAVASTVLLAGCADGIDLNGKVFDWMGISPAAQEARRYEPKLADRAPLVMPPSVNRLPEPGSEKTPDPVQAAAQTAWPDDPEQRKAREAQERQRLHEAYCRGDAQWKERLMKNDTNAPRSPYGPCPSILGNMTTNVNKN